MEERLLRYYNKELQFIREMGGEFAKQFPKIAGRLGLDGIECADPYVERLLEGFAFLAARVHLKIDSEFPHFTQHLLEMVYPHYLAPLPSMAMVQFQPDMSEGSLAGGYTLARGSVLRSVLGKDDQTACEYRTAHEVTLWPVALTAADYLPTTGAVAALGLEGLKGVKAAIVLRLETVGEAGFDGLALDRLALYLHGADERPVRVYEQLLANCAGLVVRPRGRGAKWQQRLAKDKIRPLGFDDEEALLPYGARSFQGYRLLHEYFAFPQRYLLVELSGLGAAVSRCRDGSLEVIILLDRAEPLLDGVIDASLFALNCTPAVNLFPKRADRIHLNNRQVEYHVVPDRTRPMDFEIYQLGKVLGYGTSSDEKQEFHPFYELKDKTLPAERAAYYAIERQPRLLSARQRDRGPRSSYLGTEIYLSLVDAREAPYPSSLRQLAVETLCTNRDLPMHMPVGRGATDFTVESGGPISAVRCLAGPTKPRRPLAEHDASWRLINHLSLNYLSLLDSEGEEAAPALRDILSIYGGAAELSHRKQVEGLLGVASKPVHRRLPLAGPIIYGRGLEITLTCDEAAFEGSGAFLLGAVLERFFARYVSINSFTETVIKSLDRGEIMRWPARIGSRHRI